jgi:histidine phosphotransferase ChpT
MTIMVEMRVMELLNARLLHELISPVGAINNGVELMEEEDADFVKDAMKLVANSAKTAGHRLNFYRFAYGSGRGSTGRDAANGLFDGSKIKPDWTDTATALPLEWQRLAANMLVIVAEALPRGGAVTVTGQSLGGDNHSIVVNASGDSVNLTPELRAALVDGASVDALTARTIHAFYSARVAETLGVQLELGEPGPGKVSLTTSVRA